MACACLEYIYTVAYTVAVVGVTVKLFVFTLYIIANSHQQWKVLSVSIFKCHISCCYLCVFSRYFRLHHCFIATWLKLCIALYLFWNCGTIWYGIWIRRCYVY